MERYQMDGGLQLTEEYWRIMAEVTDKASGIKKIWLIEAGVGVLA